jgi:hypothetical protein
VTGRRGRPRSANGASSFHLFWEVPSRVWVRAEAVLEVIEPPVVADLHFWALQVSFLDRGRPAGGAHLGLQWYERHPRNRAVNWGGYADRGGELPGSASGLPSATGNPSTRDLGWEPGRPYRLIVSRAEARSGRAETAWRGSIVDVGTDEEVVVRELWSPGATLDRPMVWSEVFAPCEASGSAVRWSDLRMVDDRGAAFPARRARVGYQPISDGGCVTTDSSVEDERFVQRTGTQRRTRHGARLTLPD